MQKAKKKMPTKEMPLHPDFALVVNAFAADRSVSLPGTSKGFGSGSLKVRGKIFAMMASKGEFVVKLPKERVAELVSDGDAEYFNPTYKKPMKEWAVVIGPDASWVELAKEAYRYVKGSKT
jgi:hypothetical protein